MKVKPLTRAELLQLPPVINITTLARALGISEPVARERHRQREFEDLGIRILRLGAQWRVVTADLLRVLGIDPETDAAGPARPAAIADDPHPAKERSRDHSTSAA